MKARPVFVSTHASGFMVRDFPGLERQQAPVEHGHYADCAALVLRGSARSAFSFLPCRSAAELDRRFLGSGVVGFGWTAGLA